MLIKRVFFLLIIHLSNHLCSGQVNPLDSCGIDINPFLNQYEIKVLDSLFFSFSFPKKSSLKDKNQKFDFKSKKVGFYSCTKNSNSKGKGIMSKIEFFFQGRLNFNGHAGRGFITFNEKEKIESKGFDVILIIDCPYDFINKKDLIKKLINSNN